VGAALEAASYLQRLLLTKPPALLGGPPWTFWQGTQKMSRSLKLLSWLGYLGQGEHVEQSVGMLRSAGSGRLQQAPAMPPSAATMPICSHDALGAQPFMFSVSLRAAA
jgi:hypothetical protein